jgi:hypothetical protein
MMRDAAFDKALAQLRAAQLLILTGNDPWDASQRAWFGDTLLGPQLTALELLAVAYERRQVDLDIALTEVEKHRRRYRDVEQALLALAAEIGSASQARRIIMSVFRRMEKAT